MTGVSALAKRKPTRARRSIRAGRGNRWSLWEATGWRPLGEILSVRVFVYVP
jgi:hypothetical protein